MKLQDYSTKQSITLVYTGENKGKTSASIGLLCRALGTGWKVAYIQFIKHWEVGEHKFIHAITPIYKNQLTFYKGGRGFYNAGELTAKNTSEQDHKQAALDTYNFTMECVKNGEYNLVICDEINNAVNDKLLEQQHLQDLISAKHSNTSLCLTGRNFPNSLLPLVDIATNMSKIKHHYDDGFIANIGIDY